MKRFIIKYTNGKFRQQRGINETYYYMVAIGVIDYIIDTKDGTLMFGDKDEHVHTSKISEYNDATLIESKQEQL